MIKDKINEIASISRRRSIASVRYQRSLKYQNEREFQIKKIKYRCLEFFFENKRKEEWEGIGGA